MYVAVLPSVRDLQRVTVCLESPNLEYFYTVSQNVGIGVVSIQLLLVLFSH